MNQILATENFKSKSKNNRGGQADIYAIIKFFAIILIFFGIFMVATSSYALFKNSNNNDSEALTKPEIQLENKSDREIILKIMHDTIIDRVEYYWNDEADMEVIKGNNRKYIEQNLQIPTGENTLYVKAIDINGAETSYKQLYTVVSDIQIEITLSGNNIRIDVDSVEEISFVRYYWDDEDEEEIEVNDTTYSTEIEALKGEHKLTVKVEDINGNEEEKTQTVVGTTKPNLTIEPGDNCYIIKASDEIQLDRIEIKTVEDGKVTKIQTDDKEFEYSFPLKENNENRVEITAYNSNGVASDTKKVRWKK